MVEDRVSRHIYEHPAVHEVGSFQAILDAAATGCQFCRHFALAIR